MDMTTVVITVMTSYLDHSRGSGRDNGHGMVVMARDRDDHGTGPWSWWDGFGPLKEEEEERVFYQPYNITPSHPIPSHPIFLITYHMTTQG